MQKLIPRLLTGKVELSIKEGSKLCKKLQFTHQSCKSCTFLTQSTTLLTFLLTLNKINKKKADLALKQE